MKKVILFCRVSTERQTYEEQLAELKEFTKTFGYSESEMVIIEAAGASAIKVDEEYQNMINQVRLNVEQHPSIEAIILWALDRFGRNDGILINMKNWFIEHKINLIIKNPFLILLNPDKTVNTGAEITYNVLATVAKQEMQMKQDRWQRTRTAKKRANLYNGGNIPYGYLIDKEGKYVIDPNNFIVDLFTLYATGKYSYNELAAEMQSRGLFANQSKQTVTRSISNIINNSAYIGRPSKNNRVYPAIISEELYNKCTELSKSKSFIKGKNTKKLNDKSVLLKGIIKCECGHAMFWNAKRYSCLEDNKSIMRDIVDAVVWRLAAPIYTNKVRHDSDDQKEAVTKELVLIQQKIEVSNKKIADLKARIDTLEESIYVYGRVDVDKGEKLKAQLLAAIKDEEKGITSYKEQIKKIQHTKISENYGNIDQIYQIKDPAIRYDIVHEVITDVVPVRLHGHIVELQITYYFGHTSKCLIDTYNKKLQIEENVWIKIEKEQPN